MFITVNNNGDAFNAKYDGISYEFPAGGSVTVSIEVAQHIFGVGLADKSNILTRHGWLSHSTGMDAAMARLDDFSFSLPSEVPNEIPDTLPERLKQDIAELKDNIKSPAELVPVHNPTANLSDNKPGGFKNQPQQLMFSSGFSEFHTEQ